MRGRRHRLAARAPGARHAHETGGELGAAAVALVAVVERDRRERAAVRAPGAERAQSRVSQMFLRPRTRIPARSYRRRRPSCSPRRRRGPARETPTARNSAKACESNAVPSPRPRCSRRTPSTDTQPCVGIAVVGGRQMTTPAGVPVDLRHEPERRVVDSPCLRASAATRRTESACDPSGRAKERCVQLVEQRLVDPLDRRPDSDALRPARRERRPLEVDVHPVGRPDRPYPRCSSSEPSPSSRSSATARTTPVGTRRASARASSSAMHLRHRVATDVEPEHAAVVGLIADVAVADDRAVPNSDDDVPLEVERRRLRPPPVDIPDVDLVLAAPGARRPVDHLGDRRGVVERRRPEREPQSTARSSFCQTSACQSTRIPARS